MKHNKKEVLRKIRVIAGVDAANIEDIHPDNFIGGEIPDSCRPFVFWSPDLHGYVHVGLED